MMVDKVLLWEWVEFIEGNGPRPFSTLNIDVWRSVLEGYRDKVASGMSVPEKILKGRK